MSMTEVSLFLRGKCITIEIPESSFMAFALKFICKYTGITQNIQNESLETSTQMS